MIKQIEIKGKNYPVRVGYKALQGFKAETGKTFEEMQAEGGEMPLEMFETVLYFAMVSGHKGEDKEMPWKRKDMEDVLDECFFEFTKMIPEFFPKSEDQSGNVIPNREVRREQAKEVKKGKK